jgi:coenzyme F420-reducing hydrogenase delta subunit
MCSGRVNPDFVWYAFQKGAPLVLVSGCHYVDCHYIDANRNTVRRVDALWEGLEKHGVDPRRLQLEWCSAAEGQKWARIIQELEGLRTEVTVGDVEEAREALAGKRVPRRSKVWQLEGPTPANMVCYRCGNQWEVTFDPAADRERMCSACRSNSVRVVSDGGK